MNPLRSLVAVRRSLASGELTAEELMDEARRRIRAMDRGDRPVAAFLSVTGGDGDDGSEPGTGRPAGDGGSPGTGPLAGIPVAVKDNICTLELPTTCASRLLEGYRSPYEATAVRRLRTAGARILGKTNLDEFAMGSSTENSAFGPTRNPVDRDRVPGGSSGGSAAAVAAGIVPVALGSDTGGSVRQPAALCGVVGMKPTYGRVSRYGLVAFASSLDQIGVLSGTVADAARVLEAVSGPDRRDATSVERPVPRWERAREQGLDGVIVGLPEEYLGDALHPEVRTAVVSAARELERGGADLRDVSLPSTEAAMPAYYVLAPAEASSNLARFDGIRYGVRASADGDGRAGPGTSGEETGARVQEALYEATRGGGFGPEVKRRIMLGTYALSAGYYEDYYLRARSLQRQVAGDFRRVFDDGVDVLLTPTTPAPAFRLGERTDEPYRMYRSDVFTVAANLSGVPAVSVPVGLADGLPVGAQLMAPRWQEERLLGIAARLEERAAFTHPLAEECG